MRDYCALLEIIIVILLASIDANAFIRAQTTLSVQKSNQYRQNLLIIFYNRLSQYISKWLLYGRLKIFNTHHSKIL